MKAVKKYNMDSAISRRRTAAMTAEFMRCRSATVADLVLALGVGTNTVGRFLAHLVAAGVIKQVVEARSGRGISIPAVYELVQELDADTDGDECPLPVARQMVGANDWPRGEHAYRSGLLAYLFPLSAECQGRAA